MPGPPKDQLRPRAAAIIVLAVAVTVLASSMAPQAPQPGELDVTPATGERLEVIERYIVSGVESWDDIIVASTGQLVVPSGASLVASNVELDGYCILELTGGSMVVKGVYGGSGISGMCRHLRITNGSRLEIEGQNGASPLASSAGSAVLLDLAFTHEMVVMDSTIVLRGGNGGSPDAPVTTGSLTGHEYSGGDATLVFTSLSTWSRVTIMNSTLEVIAGAGGNAPDGAPPTTKGGGAGGGFTAGGYVSGRVGAGGHSRVSIDSDSIFVDRSVITCHGGKGGDAGDGGEASGSFGSGGGGYSGGEGAGDFREFASTGGDVSGEVGSGGDARLRVEGPDIAFGRTLVEVEGGTGGKAGDGGHSTGSPGPGGGAGGGGYSGGGGGSLSEPSAAPGGEVGDNVGSGGESIVTLDSSETLEMDATSMDLSSGRGGNAGDGGRTQNRQGGGGGGFSGGGGAGSSDITGQEARFLGGDGGEVSGSVARGADANMLVNAARGIFRDCNLTVMAGTGGDGGSSGRSRFDDAHGLWTGGGGGGSYSAGGGGGHAPDGLFIGLGGDGGPVTGKVGDGGDASLRLKVLDPTILESCRLSAGRGRGGTCWRADALGEPGGDGVGRATASGRAYRYIPISRPVLLYPEDGLETNGTPNFNWTLLGDSTTNGHVTGYDIQFSLDAHYSAVFEMFMTSETNVTVLSLPKGTVFWRVRAIYSRPSGRTGPWSDGFRFTHTNSPPTIAEIPVFNVTVKQPRSLDLGPYLDDLDDPRSSLIVSFDEHPGVLWHALTQVTLLYDVYEEPHEVEFTVSDGHDRTFGYIPVRVIDRNRAPVIRAIGNQTPPAAFSLEEGERLLLPVKVVDLDGDVPHLYLVSSWDGASLLPDDTLLIDAKIGDVGIHRVVVTAEDTRGGYDRAEVDIRVGNVGEPPLPPVFLSPRNGTVYHEGNPVTFTVDLEDPDFIYGDTVLLTVVSDVSGILISMEANDDVSFTTDQLDPGEHLITALVKDDIVSKRGEVRLIVVADPEAPPVWDPPEGLGTLLVMIVLSMVALGMSYYVGYRLKNR